MNTPDEHLLNDLYLRVSHRSLRPVYEVDASIVRSGAAVARDFKLVRGRQNLEQAIVMRLLTPRGELSHLGHPDYGSRLHELIGAGNTETNRDLMRLFIIDSLQREPRIEKLIELNIYPSPGTRGTVDVALKVQPIEFSSPIEIGPFSIDLG